MALKLSGTTLSANQFKTPEEKRVIAQAYSNALGGGGNAGSNYLQFGTDRVFNLFIQEANQVLRDRARSLTNASENYQNIIASGNPEDVNSTGAKLHKQQADADRSFFTGFANSLRDQGVEYTAPELNLVQDAQGNYVGGDVGGVQVGLPAPAGATQGQTAQTVTQTPRPVNPVVADIVRQGQDITEQDISSILSRYPDANRENAVMLLQRQGMVLNQATTPLYSGQAKTPAEAALIAKSGAIGAYQSGELGMVTAEQAKEAIAKNLPETPSKIDGTAVSGEEKPTAASTFVGNYSSDATTNAAINNFVNSSMSGLEKTIMSIYQAQQTAAETARKTVEAESESLKSGLEANLTSTYSQDKAKALMEEYELKIKQDNLKTILTDINAEKEKMNLGITQEGERIAPLSILGRRQKAVESRGLARIATLTGTAEIIQGDIANAKDSINFMMSAINADRSEQIDAYKTLLSLSENKVISLKADEKEAVNNQMIMLQNEITQMEANKDKILELMLNYPEAIIKGKVTITDSYEDAISKITPFLGEIADKEYVKDIMGKYPDANILPSDSLAVAQAKLKTSKIYQEQVRAPSGSSTVKSSISADEKAMYEDISKGQDDLRAGTSWGSVYNTIKSKWGVPDDILDSLLGGGIDEEGLAWGWAKPGAYQEFKGSTGSDQLLLQMLQK